MTHYKGLDAQTLEREYNLVARRGATSFSTLMGQWASRSEQVRTNGKANAKLNLPYGDGPREQLDYFYSGNPIGPLLIYIHGGYWQRGDKSLYSFLSEAYIQNGISLAILNYGLTPETPFSEIPNQIRNAIFWCLSNAQQLQFSSKQLHLMGHSAGGHLAALMLATNWQHTSPLLPTEVIRSATLISGVYELEPLIHTSLNTALNLDVEQANAFSPCNLIIESKIPQLVVVGENETAEFHRQSTSYVDKFNSSLKKLEPYTVPKADHFDEINALSEPNSSFLQKTVELINNCR